MGKKFKQILEGKHRHHSATDMGKSTCYVVIHEICTDKLLTPEEKAEVIIGFCQGAITVQDIADRFKNENLE